MKCESASADEPVITPEQLALFRRCQFARRIFASYPLLRQLKGTDEEDGWRASEPYTGQPFDPEEFELIEGGWDHEHCDVCWVTISDGTAYWPNVDEDAGDVDLCESCYPRVLSMLAAPK